MYLAVGTTTTQSGESRSEIGIRGYADPLISYVALGNFLSFNANGVRKKSCASAVVGVMRCAGPRGRNMDWPGGGSTRRHIVLSGRRLTEASQDGNISDNVISTLPA